MSEFTVEKINNVDTFVLAQTLNQTLVDDGHVTIDAPTKNKFVDKDIHIDLTVPSAADPTLSITDLTGSLSMGTAADGVYSPTVSLSGNANVGTAGWITAGNHAVSDNSVAVGKVNQSTLKNGTTAINSGSTVTPTVSSNQTINISEGYNAARTVVVASMDSAGTQKATVNSADVSIGTSDLTIAYDSTNHDFNVTGSKTIGAPSVGTAGFISATAGTKNTGTATIAADLDEIAIGVSANDKKVTPVIARTAFTVSGVTDAASGAVTTNQPSSGVYVKVDAAGVADTITASPTVTSDGYGTTTQAAKTNKTINVGSNAAASAYVPIKVGTVSASNATISSVSVAYDSTNHDFNVTGSTAIAAPTVGTEGYVSSSVGTKNGATANVAADLAEVKVGVTPSTTSKKVTPVIARTAFTKSGVVDAASGAASTSEPTSGAYVKVDAAAVSDSLTVEGKVSTAGYGTTDHFQKDSATTINVGSNAAASAYIPIAAGTVTSGTAIISSVGVAYNSTGGNFNVTGSADVSAPTAGTAGYVGGGVGTLSAKTGGATVAASLAKVGIGASVTGGDAVTPVISKNAATNVNASSAVTAKPSSGFYVAVATAATSSTVNASAAVTSAGYGTTTAGQYTTTGASKTVNVNASATTYVPITAGTLANSASNSVTYTELTSAPIIPSEGYLFINEGYYTNSKISLARLVPDDATITYASGAGYILAGESAYDSDGKLVVGTIETYNGAYTIA